MAVVTLEQILLNREERVMRQRSMIEKYSCPVISFTMNIPGPEKTSTLIERAFFEGLCRIKKSLPENAVKEIATRVEITGCEALICVDEDALKLKRICVGIEEESPLGRLFDMDIIDPDGKKFERQFPRRCIICGKDVWECASKRVHPVSELQSATKKIITDYFAGYDSERIADLAVECLIKEVNTTPKPGLVDLRNNGSHTDMNASLFLKSAKALKRYFEKCVLIGIENKGDIFPLLREEGIIAEKEMYDATNGVNTHKGIIYSLGILCASVGNLWSAEKPVDVTDAICRQSAKIAGNYIKADFASITPSTAGGRLYLEKGIAGIRGEVLSGFESVTEISLPVYKKFIDEGTDENFAGCIALLHLISKINDTNLYHRGGTAGAEFARNYAKNLVDNKHLSIKDIEGADDEFIERNLSPGGCADLLAITYFLYELCKK